MLNVLWCGMVFLGVVWGIISGNMGLLTDGILNGAGDAISLCITMAGILSFWCGLMKETGRGETAIVPRGTASREMCTFLILNISSLQLIPVNMIAYRSRYGSGMPEVIVGPAILVTLASTAAAVLFCRIMERSDDRKNRRRE